MCAKQNSLCLQILFCRKTTCEFLLCYCIWCVHLPWQCRRNKRSSGGWPCPPPPLRPLFVRRHVSGTYPPIWNSRLAHPSPPIIIIIIIKYHNLPTPRHLGISNATSWFLYFLCTFETILPGRRWKVQQSQAVQYWVPGSTGIIWLPVFHFPWCGPYSRRWSQSLHLSRRPKTHVSGHQHTQL